MVKHYRTQKNGSAIWKILEYTDLQSCPECNSNKNVIYLGFVETYMTGLHAKMYQCLECDTWVDVIWNKEQGRYDENHSAGV